MIIETKSTVVALSDALSTRVSCSGQEQLLVHVRNGWGNSPTAAYATAESGNRERLSGFAAGY